MAEQRPDIPRMRWRHLLVVFALVWAWGLLWYFFEPGGELYDLGFPSFMTVLLLGLNWAPRGRVLPERPWWSRVLVGGVLLVAMIAIPWVLDLVSEAAERWVVVGYLLAGVLAVLNGFLVEEPKQRYIDVTWEDPRKQEPVDG